MSTIASPGTIKPSEGDGRAGTTAQGSESLLDVLRGALHIVARQEVIDSIFRQEAVELAVGILGGIVHLRPARYSLLAVDSAEEPGNAVCCVAAIIIKRVDEHFKHVVGRGKADCLRPTGVMQNIGAGGGPAKFLIDTHTGQDFFRIDKVQVFHIKV